MTDWNNEQITVRLTSNDPKAPGTTLEPDDTHFTDAGWLVCRFGSFKENSVTLNKYPPHRVRRVQKTRKKTTDDEDNAETVKA